MLLYYILYMAVFCGALYSILTHYYINYIWTSANTSGEQSMILVALLPFLP